MIDSHCHLDLPPFAPDWQDVVAQATEAGVQRFLIPGTTVAGWQCQMMMAAKCNRLDIAFGLHPYFFPDDLTQALNALRTILTQSEVRPVAVGEIGIDGAISVPLEAQQALFEAQLQLASEFALPVIIHHRQSHHLILASLKRARYQGGGVIHAFSGSVQVAQQYIQAGFKLGIGGTITYSRANKTRKAVGEIALEHLLLETDAPDMPVAGRQGERNSPQYLNEIAEVLAQLKQLSIGQISQQTTTNYHQLFGSLTQ